MRQLNVKRCMELVHAEAELLYDCLKSFHAVVDGEAFTGAQSWLLVKHVSILVHINQAASLKDELQILLQ